MKMGLASLAAVASLAAAMALTACEPTEPIGSVTFITPKDGETVRPTHAVIARVKDMKRVKAGVEHEDGGHVVVLVDLDELPPHGQPVPEGAFIDRKNQANLTDGDPSKPGVGASQLYGENMVLHIVNRTSGEADVQITVTVGEHTEQLMMVDHNSVPLKPYVVSKKITVYAKSRSGGLRGIPGADRPGTYQGTRAPKN